MLDRISVITQTHTRTRVDEQNENSGMHSSNNKNLWLCDGYCCGV